MINWRTCRFVYRAWRRRLRDDREQIAFMLSKLKPGDTTLDIGAHKGAYSYWMARAVGANGHVHSFEPQVELASVLQINMQRLHLKQVQVHHQALSDQAGQGHMQREGQAPSPGAKLNMQKDASKTGFHGAVTVGRLDDMLAQMHRRVTFIKCDVEGHELSVFRGGEQLLRRDRPALLVEIEQRHHAEDSIAEVFEFLQGLGYRSSFDWQGKRLPGEAFDLAQMQVWGREPYVGDFYFEPR